MIPRDWIRDNLTNGIEMKTNTPVMSFIYLESNFLGFICLEFIGKDMLKLIFLQYGEKY